MLWARRERVVEGVDVSVDVDGETKLRSSELLTGARQGLGRSRDMGRQADAGGKSGSESNNRRTQSCLFPILDLFFPDQHRRDLREGL